MSQERTVFKSKLGVLLATLSSAVGLGNIWKFPAVAGTEGGGAFVLIYILACLVLGLPLMIAEISLGRHGKTNVFGAIQSCTNHKFWLLIPVLSLLASICVLAYYTDIAGWVLTYFGYAISGNLNATTPQLAQNFFIHVSTTTSISFTAQCIFIFALAAILLLGITTGIERIIKMILPLLFIILIVIAVYNLFLEGATEGLRFLFEPDFSKISAATFLNATGLAFFKLAIGLGSLYTYGAYFPKDQNIPLVSLRVMFGDLIISLVAGIAIFPAVFTYHFPVQEGASLLFLTIPMMFANVYAGNVLTALFFLLTLLATVGASTALLEVSISVFQQKFRRHFSVLLATLLTVIVGFLATSSMASNAPFSIFGYSAFSLFSMASDYYLMPFSAFFTALFVGWFLKKETIFTELTNGNTIHIKGLNVWLFTIRYIVPSLLILLFITNVL